MTTSKSDPKSDSKSGSKAASADVDETVDAPPVAPIAEPATEAPSVIADPSESTDDPGPPSDVGGPQTVAIPKSRLVQEAGAFLGVSAATAAGALAELDDDHELTVDEARKALASFGVEL